MGRQVRRVPADWHHPLKSGEEWQHFDPDLGPFIPLKEVFKPHIEMLRDYLAEMERWDRGENPDRVGALAGIPYCEYDGDPPQFSQCMPYWPPEQRTHYQMYEDTSEGTPRSPVFATPEMLAHWLTENGVSMCGDDRGSYEDWLRIARGEAEAIGMISQNGSSFSPLVVPKE